MTTPYRSAVTAISDLVNYWPQADVSGIYGCPLTVTGATVQILRLGRSRLFDGIDDVLVQAALASGHTSATVSLENGVAFVNLPAITTLSQFAGAAGVNKRFALVMVDVDGNTAFAYVGALGTGETLGSELITSWQNLGLATLTLSGTNITSAIAASGGTAYQVIASQQYKLLKWTSNIVKNSGTFTTVRISPLPNGDSPYVELASNLTTSSYSVYINSRYNNLYFRYAIASDVACNFSASNNSLKQVLTPSTSGCVLYSTRAGSTQNLAHKHASFNANSLASATIYQSDFWGNFSGGMAIAIPFLSTDANGCLISKGKTTTSLLSYMLRLESGKLAAYVSSDGATPISAVTIGTYNDGVRHIVVMNYTGALLELWVDGVKVTSTKTDVPVTLFDSPEPLRLGDNGNRDNPYAGELSDGAIWSRNLLQAEIEGLNGLWGTRAAAGVRAVVGARTPVVGRTPVVRP